MTMRQRDTPLILASGSRTRFDLLRRAGLHVRAYPVDVNEATIRNEARARGAEGGEIAVALAHAKARCYSLRQDAEEGALVIAADQILTCEDRQIDKAPDLTALREILVFLRGRTHILQTACVIYQDGAPIWTHLARPRLQMRHFSDAFLDDYLHKAGEAVLSSVGGYQLEGRGVQLFEKIEGAYDDILGLPLLPLLSALRQLGAMA
ncbi:MAG: Maf family protein [Acetobacteraceae bacterium]